MKRFEYWQLSKEAKRTAIDEIMTANNIAVIHNNDFSRLVNHYTFKINGKLYETK